MNRFPTSLQYNPANTEKEEMWWRYLDKGAMKIHSKAGTRTVCENEKEGLESSKKTETGDCEKRISTNVGSVENAGLVIPSVKNMEHEIFQNAGSVCSHCRQFFPSPFHLLEHVPVCSVLTGVQKTCEPTCYSSQNEETSLPLKFDRHGREMYSKQCIHGVCNSDLNKQDIVLKQAKCIHKSELSLSSAICATFLKLPLDFQKESDTCGKCGKCSKCKTMTSQKTSQNCERPYQCDHCNANFKQWADLKNHQYVHNSDKPYVCDTSVTSFNLSRVMKMQKIIHSNKKPYICDVCNAAFKQSSHLKQHKRVHTNETPYVCDMCSASFKQSIHLKQHRRVHTNEKPYVCDTCPSAFKQSEHLKQHKRIHTNETPYACDMCSAAFKQSVHLKQHRRIHTNEKPYSCNICDAAFKQSEHLKLHKRTHTNEKPYACDLCSAAFKQSAHLKQHKRTHASGKVITETFGLLEPH